MARRLSAALVAVALALLLAPELASACAALFSPEADVKQSAQRIIFTMDRAAGEVSAYVQVAYTGAAEEFAWVVPLPSNPEVAVVENASFAAIEKLTEPVYRFPKRPECFELRLFDGFGGAGSGAPPGAGGVNVYQQGAVGPYDYSVVGGENAAELTEWLLGNGYRVTPAMEPLIKVYTDERMLFLAMKLQVGQNSSAIQPVKMTFKADKPMIPIRLAAVGAEPDTAIMVWIFADGQTAPTNMQRLVIPDEAVTVTDFGGANNYRDARRAAIKGVGGQGFVVEYALPTRQLASDDPLIKELAGKYSFLTRLYGTMSPEEMTSDPVFDLGAGLPDRSNVHDLTGRINPYDCGSRDVLAAADQLVAPDSPRGLWLRFGWLLPWAIGLALVLVGLTWAVRQLRRA